MNFGFDQLILNNNYLNRYLTIQLSEQAQVFTISDDQFLLKLKQSKAQLNQFLASPIEYYQQAKDHITFNTQQNQQCFVCKIKGHTLVNCNKFHLNNNRVQKYPEISKKWNQQRKFNIRKRLKSVKNTSKKSLQQLQNQLKNYPYFDFSILKKVLEHSNFVQSVLEKTIQQTMNKYMQNIQSKNQKPQQTYFKWKIYCPQGQLQF